MNHRFFDDEPRDWRELEKLVALAFHEMRYEVHQDYELTTVRGKVRVDVFAINRLTPLPTIVICECKYWAKKVSQNVIHSFRTVCADSGSHFGVIVSKKGFQIGAEESRNSTNVHLLDFTQFQETFFQEWKTGAFMMMTAMRSQLLPIFRAQTGRSENGLDVVAKSSLEGVNSFEKYSVFFGLDGSYADYFIHNRLFPQSIPDPRGDPRVLSRVLVHSHREYLEIAKEGTLFATKHFGLPDQFIREAKLDPVD